MNRARYGSNSRLSNKDSLIHEGLIVDQSGTKTGSVHEYNRSNIGHRNETSLDVDVRRTASEGAAEPSFANNETTFDFYPIPPAMII